MHDIPKGLRLFAVVRRSKQKQHESIERQRELIRMLLKMNGAVQYDELVLDDHSSTLGEQWEAYYRLIERKRNGEQFDGICASEYARIGRNMDDCEEYARKLKRARLKLITHKEGSMIGKDKWITRQAAAHANEKYAESIAVNMNGSIMGLIKRGVLPHTQVPLFGTDRLHISLLTRKPLFRLRWVQGQSVLRLHPDDIHAERPIDIYEGATRDDYPRRQRDERVILVPGDPALLKIVRRLFELRYGPERCGYSEIADVLNSQVFKSPTGIDWRFYQVRAILHNEAYTGVGVCCKDGCGVHSWRHENGPQTFELPRDPGENAKGFERQKLETIRRPIEDWYVGRCPELRPILGRKLRRRAKASNSKRRHTPVQTHRVEGIRRSTFFLSGLVIETNTNSKMWGITTKVVNGVPYRYYYVDRYGAKNKSLYARLPVKSIRAEHAEQAFFEIVRTILLNQNDTVGRITNMLKARLNDRSRNAALSELLDERRKHQRRLDLILSVDARYRVNAVQDLKQIEKRLGQLDAAIAGTKESGDLTDEGQIPSVVKGVMARIKEWDWIINAGSVRLRTRLAWLLLSSITFDGMTGIVSFNVRLPTLFLLNPQLLDDLFWSAVTSRKNGNGTLKQFAEISLGNYRYRIEAPAGRKRSEISYLGCDSPKVAA